MQISCASASALHIELKPEEAKQGQTVEVLVHSDASDATGSATKESDPALPAVLFRSKSYKCFPVPSSSDAADTSAASVSGRALLGVPADLDPGNYKVKVGDQETVLKVVAGQFPVQSIHLPPGKDNFNASPGEEAAVDAAKASLNPHQYWDGKFLHPSKARVSSAFGLRRRVNGKLLKDYFHSGLDFAGATGSPVVACQKGKVIIAHQGWKLHGNTVCIDHGQGVVSFYIHLSKILVKEGDMVNAGEKIGLIGSTGRASGPHLHFSLYVNKDATSPWDWFNHAF